MGSTSGCQSAVTLLEGVGRQPDNARYVSVLASAYACLGGFGELDLFDEIDVIVAGVDTFFPSITLLSTSEETQAESDNYQDILTGIEIALRGGNLSIPSAAAREANLGERAGSNLSIQALYMIIVELGKYMHFYGNVDDAGVKGGGAPNVDEQGPTASECFYTYDYASAIAYISGSGLTGICDNNGDPGHPDLDPGDLPTTYQRMCQGVVLFNNLVDILNTVTLSSSEDLGELPDLIDDINTSITTATTAYPELTDILEITDQDECEDYAGTNFDQVQLFFAVVFESGLP